MTDQEKRDIVMAVPDWWPEFEAWLQERGLQEKQKWNDGFIWRAQFLKETGRDTVAI